MKWNSQIYGFAHTHTWSHWGWGMSVPTDSNNSHDSPVAVARGNSARSTHPLICRSPWYPGNTKCRHTRDIVEKFSLHLQKIFSNHISRGHPKKKKKAALTSTKKMIFKSNQRNKFLQIRQTFPVSTTYFIPGMVIEVSATLVETTQSRQSGGGDWNTYATTQRITLENHQHLHFLLSFS